MKKHPLLESYERLFGRIVEGYFDNYDEPYGIMVSTRSAREASEIINDDPYFSRKQPRNRGTNIFLFNNYEDLMDVVSKFSNRSIEIDKLRIDGEEIDYDPDQFDPHNFQD